jgi:hypothetical protein
LIGLAMGYALLYFSPGQSLRYGGLVTQQSLLQRIFSRSPQDSLRIVRTFAVAVACTAPWWIVAWWARRHRASTVMDRRLALAMFVTGGLMALTLFGSPKYGPRLYFAPTALAILAAAIWIRPALDLRGGPRLLMLMAAVAMSGYGFTKLVVTYSTVGDEFLHRMTLLQRGVAGTQVVVPPYSAPPSRWFLGDDLTAAGLREWIAGELKLSSIAVEKPTTR